MPARRALIGFLAAWLPLAVPFAHAPCCILWTSGSPRRHKVQMIDVDIISGGRPSRELLTFERMVKVKPYPARCPYEGVEDFTTVDSLGLVPPPTSAEAAALQKLYARHFPRKPDAVLEVVCDGKSFLPRRPASRRSAQLHLSDASLQLGMGSNPHLEHRTLPSLTSTASDSSSSEQTLCYQTGYADSTFECIFSHASPAYADAPLQLFEELFRTLKPAGTLTLSFYAPIATEIKLGEELRNKPQSDVETPHCIGRFASRAWLQAQDGADLLYMVGSFYYYTGEWKAIQAEELCREGDRALYAVTATKLSNRATMVRRAQNDLFRTRLASGSLPPGSLPSAPSRKAATQGQAVRETAQSSRSTDDGRRTRARSLVDEMRAERSAAQKKSGDDAAAVREKGDMIRAKILDTIKKGIYDARERTDLADGERKMLEHMKLYVMETKVAETELTPDERLIWEDMKSEYLEMRGIDEKPEQYQS
mmetsp:Transcript_31688/g.78967  ORF Transcript_31688/g.78967 Transcript_31688/m.78967 type:complete len:479 (-) Transcript_31688:206-1642(-)